MRIKNKVLVTIPLAFVVGILSVAITPAKASTLTKGIAVTPALREVILAENSPEASFTFTLTNTTSTTASLRLSLLDFGALNESGGVAFIGRGGQETTSYGLKQWMVLEKEVLTLGIGESQDVRATVINKSSLPAGGHYGAIVVTSEQDQSTNKDSVAVLPSTGVLVLLKKTGGDRADLKLPSIITGHSVISLPTSASLRFRNDGNVHLVPRGTVKIQDPMRKIIARGIINEESGFILPESYRVYKVSFAKAVSGWLPGRYNIITTWRYDGQTAATTTVTQVWYIGLIPTVALGLVVFSICTYIVQKQFSRKKHKQTHVEHK